MVYIQDLHAMITLRSLQIFMTTHNMAKTSKLCDSVVLLCNGEIIECGNPKVYISYCICILSDYIYLAGFYNFLIFLIKYIDLLYRWY